MLSLSSPGAIPANTCRYLQRSFPRERYSKPIAVFVRLPHGLTARMSLTDECSCLYDFMHANQYVICNISLKGAFKWQAAGNKQGRMVQSSDELTCLYFESDGMPLLKVFL